MSGAVTPREKYNFMLMIGEKNEKLEHWSIKFENVSVLLPLICAAKEKEVKISSGEKRKEISSVITLPVSSHFAAMASLIYKPFLSNSMIRLYNEVSHHSAVSLTFFFFRWTAAKCSG